MREVTLAAVQMESTRDMQANLEKALHFIGVAKRRGAQAVCLPEAWLSGTAERSRRHEEFLEFVVDFKDKKIGQLRDAARKHGIFLVAGGIYEREGDKIYNTVPIIRPDGEILAKVRKSHLENAPVKAETDHKVTVGAPDYLVFDTEIGKIGVVVDIDICALEVPRILGIKGAEIIFWPFSWTADAHDCISIYGKAAATITDGVVVGASHFGWGKHFEMDYFLGGSGIIDLRTYVAYVADYTEGVAVATVDLDRVGQRREMIRDYYPFWRRPETYGALLDVELEKRLRGGQYNF
jgi:predicted amidohydrolase